MNKKSNNKSKILISIFAIGIIIGIIIYLFPVFKNLMTSEGRIQFKEQYANTGFKGVLALFGLQLAQIFFVIIPGEPIEILAGMCYGGFWGTIFILVSVFIITTTIFFLVRKYGREFVHNFFDKEKVSKMENSKLFQNPSKIELVMFISFFIPGTPKDLLIYIGGLLPVKPWRFILISTFARIPSIISSTLAGTHLIKRKLENIDCSIWCSNISCRIYSLGNK